MTAQPAGRAGPLATLTIATNALAPLRLFLETGHGLQCLGPLALDDATRRARAALWRVPEDFGYLEYHFVRAGIDDAACIRVLLLDRPSEAWRGTWEPAVRGPYTIGFPNIAQEALDTRLRLLGFGARNPLERTLFRHPDGRSWEILESLATAPDFIAAVGIARGAGSPPISPVNAQGLGGPAYSMCIVEDTDRMAGFMRDALGFEIRNRRRQASAGRQGAMNTPDGTQFEIAQACPPYGAHGFLILLQFTNLPVAEPPRPPRLPATGLVMYSFPVDDIEAVLRQAATAGAREIHGPILFADPRHGEALHAGFIAPGGIAFELFQVAR
jgi:catechol 2,3-dioxygenase-like lactoylglutathione lyase family enzyme